MLERWTGLCLQRLQTFENSPITDSSASCYVTDQDQTPHFSRLRKADRTSTGLSLLGSPEIGDSFLICQRRLCALSLSTLRNSVAGYQKSPRDRPFETPSIPSACTNLGKRTYAVMSFFGQAQHISAVNRRIRNRPSESEEDVEVQKEEGEEQARQGNASNSASELSAGDSDLTAEPMAEESSRSSLEESCTLTLKAGATMSETAEQASKSHKSPPSTTGRLDRLPDSNRFGFPESTAATERFDFCGASQFPHVYEVNDVSMSARLATVGEDAREEAREESWLQLSLGHTNSESNKVTDEVSVERSPESDPSQHALVTLQLLPEEKIHASSGPPEEEIIARRQYASKLREEEVPRTFLGRPSEARQGYADMVSASYGTEMNVQWGGGREAFLSQGAAPLSSLGARMGSFGRAGKVAWRGNVNLGFRQGGCEYTYEREPYIRAADRAFNADNRLVKAAATEAALTANVANSPWLRRSPANDSTWAAAGLGSPANDPAWAALFAGRESWPGADLRRFNPTLLYPPPSNSVDVAKSPTNSVVDFYPSPTNSVHPSASRFAFQPFVHHPPRPPPQPHRRPPPPPSDHLRHALAATPTPAASAAPSAGLHLASAPPSRGHPGIWFSLEATPPSNNEDVDDELPPMQKLYMRIKDGEMPISVVKKYLVRKLGLSSEAEVQISCRGNVLEEDLRVQHVRDNIWLPTQVEDQNVLGFRSPIAYSSSLRERVMAFTYKRPSQGLTLDLLKS